MTNLVRIESKPDGRIDNVTYAWSSTAAPHAHACRSRVQTQPPVMLKPGIALASPGRDHDLMFTENLAGKSAILTMTRLNSVKLRPPRPSRSHASMTLLMTSSTVS